MNRRFSRTLPSLLCILMGASPALTADLKLPRDGWASWQVPAVDDAPAWCCWDWKDAGSKPSACRLDGVNEGYGSRDGATTEHIRVYAYFSAGKVERLRALAATCPVQTNTVVRDLGAVAAAESARWLADSIGATSRAALDREALAALAIHRGEVAQQTLTDFARNDASSSTRKEAVFWLAHLHGLAGATVATAIMFGDKDPDVREHAAFAVSQSGSPQTASDLIRLASADSDPGVRGKAWFWLAKTGSAVTEAAIAAALRKEASDEVRHQAIFALSQLPDERATSALIDVAEDRSQTRDDRGRAVFWLAQSEQAGAQAYLEKVLSARAR